MGVLDTFFILFDIDTSKVKQGADDAKKSASGMAREIMGAGEAAGAVGGKFMAMVQQAGALAAAYFAVSTYAAAINETEALGRAASTLGDAVEDVDAFGRAAARAGGDVHGAMDSLTDISEKVGEALQDTESQAAKTFSGLKIKLKDTQGQTKGAVAAMLELAGAVEGMSREEAIFKIKELGVTDNRTVDLLLKGRVALEDMMKSEKAFGVVTKEDTEAATKFKQSLQSTTSTFGLMVTKINTAILPAITWMIDGFRHLVNFLGEHQTFVAAFFAGIAAIVSYIYLPAILTAAAATLAAIAPFLLIGAAIAAVAAAFALIYDDIQAFLDGQDSVIGEISKNWPIVGEIVRAIAAEIGFLKDIWLAVFGLIADSFTSPDEALDNFKASLQAAIDKVAQAYPEVAAAARMIGDAFEAMGNGVISVWGAIVVAIKAAISVVTGAIDTVVSAYKRVKGFVGLGGGNEGGSGGGAGASAADTMDAIRKGQAAIATASTTPLAAQTSTSIANSRSVSRNNTVEVNGPINIQTQATDADGISKSIGSSLNDQMRQAANNFDDGVAG